jgi:hypothetical protein
MSRRPAAEAALCSELRRFAKRLVDLRLPARAMRCLAIFASRFGSSQTIFMRKRLLLQLQFKFDQE